MINKSEADQEPIQISNSEEPTPLVGLMKPYEETERRNSFDNKRQSNEFRTSPYANYTKQEATTQQDYERMSPSYPRNDYRGYDNLYPGNYMYDSRSSGYSTPYPYDSPVMQSMYPYSVNNKEDRYVPYNMMQNSYYGGSYGSYGPVPNLYPMSGYRYPMKEPSPSYYLNQQHNTGDASYQMNLMGSRTGNSNYQSVSNSNYPVDAMNQHKRLNELGSASGYPPNLQAASYSSNGTPTRMNGAHLGSENNKSQMNYPN